MNNSLQGYISTVSYAQSLFQYWPNCSILICPSCKLAFGWCYNYVIYDIPRIRTLLNQLRIFCKNSHIYKLW